MRDLGDGTYARNYLPPSTGGFDTADLKDAKALLEGD